jgi:hypothetical protein
MQIHPSIPAVVVQWLTPDKSFYQEWDFWVSFGTLLLAFITGWLAWETRGLRQDSAKAIAASEETARSATASAAIAQAAMERSLRAYVTVERPEPFNQNAAKIPHDVNVTMINTGQTPARKLEIFCCFGVRDEHDLPKGFDAERDSLRKWNQTDIGKDQRRTIFEQYLKEADFKAIQEFSKLLVVFGAVRDHGMFSEQDRVTEFSYAWDVNRQHFSSVGEMNAII